MDRCDLCSEPAGRDDICHEELKADDHEDLSRSVTCTRAAGHDGQHAACAPRNHPVVEWGDDQ